MSTVISQCPYCRKNLELTLAKQDSCPSCHTKFYFTQSRTFKKVEKLKILKKQQIIGVIFIPLLLFGIFLRSRGMTTYGGVLLISAGLLLVSSFFISNHCLSKYGFFDPWYLHSGEGSLSGPYFRKDNLFFLNLLTLYLELLVGLVFIVMPFFSVG